MMQQRRLLLLLWLLCWGVALAPVPPRGNSPTATSDTTTLNPETLSAQSPAPSSDKDAENSSSLVLLCTADGTLFVVDAWTGALVSKSRTGRPLLTRSVVESTRQSNNQDTNESSNNQQSNKDVEEEEEEEEEEDESVILAHHIVPGLDGKLYWQDNRHEEVDDSDTENYYDTTDLQALPLSIPSLLQHPVRTCSEQTAHACGILHAVEHVALLGLHPTSGALQWSTAMTSTSTTEEFVDYLILQRKDVSIQQVSSRTGQQLWNITMGSYQAVDFDGAARERASSLLDDDDDLENNNVVSRLPLLAFLPDGRQLVAVDRQGDSPILWRIEAPSKVASIFGILDGQWHPIDTLEGFMDQKYTSPKHMPLLLADAPYREGLQQPAWLDEWATEKWIKEEMFRNYYEHVNQQRSRSKSNVQGLLPSPEDGESLKILGAPKYLFELPAATPVTVVPPDGLVLSWEFVNALLIGIATLCFLGFLLYRRQKQLLRRAQLRVNIAESARRNPPRESQSMPGDVQHKGSVINPIQSDPGEVHLVPEGQKTSGSATSNPDEVEEQGVIQQGGIPLVRYARFRSEFEQLQALGSGGFGTVFKCRNNLDGREYAIKKVSIRRKREDDTTFNQRLQRVLREVKILAVLDHPNIVRYYTAWLEVENTMDDETEHARDDMSQCFSSSYLTNAHSLTNWDKSTTKSRRFQNQWSVDSNTQSSDIFLPSVPPHRMPVSGQDLGFIFEESNEPEDVKSAAPKSGSAIQETEGGLPNANPGYLDDDNPRYPVAGDNGTSVAENPLMNNDAEFSQRHTLYIQMQLCSFDNLSDFVADADARKGCLAQGIDIGLALRLFLQIARAVQYVHEKGLIHRDLKPTNCFVDEGGRIKVGDFGLSRESGDKDDSNIIEAQSSHACDDDQTAGVGTRLYASPEQSAGSAYDSSTDIYSLGIILFELCYPMYTGMERNICISRLRDKHEFPSDWDSTVTASFPTLRELLLSMLSNKPENRPKASDVADHIQDVLGELTIISVGTEETSSENLILLRVEADSDPDALANTMGQIRQAAQPGSVDILQYGLSQSKDSHTIMEFALRSSPEVEAGVLVSRLKQRPRILTARQVSLST